MPETENLNGLNVNGPESAPARRVERVVIEIRNGPLAMHGWWVALYLDDSIMSGTMPVGPWSSRELAEGAKGDLAQLSAKIREMRDTKVRVKNGDSRKERRRKYHEACKQRRLAAKEAKQHAKAEGEG